MYWESFNNNIWSGVFQRFLISFPQLPNINIRLELRSKLNLPLGTGIVQRGSEGGSREEEGAEATWEAELRWSQAVAASRGRETLGRENQGGQISSSFRGVWGGDGFRVGVGGREERARKNWENRGERRKQKWALSRDQENPLVWPFFECFGLGLHLGWLDNNQRDVRVALSPTGRGCICMQFLMGPVDSSGRRDGGFTGPQVSNRQLLQTVGICCDIYC